MLKFLGLIVFIMVVLFIIIMVFIGVLVIVILGLRFLKLDYIKNELFCLLNDY